MENQNLPACTARAFLRRTKNGSVIKVRLITPAGLAWRTYQMPLGLDDAVVAALRSTAQPAAFVHLALPSVIVSRPAQGEHHNQRQEHIGDD